MDSLYIKPSLPKSTNTIYVQIFEGCNCQGFRGQLAICKISSLKFHLQNFGLHQSERRILDKNKIAKMLDLYMVYHAICKYITIKGVFDVNTYISHI